MNAPETEPASAGLEIVSISAADPDWMQQCGRVAEQRFEVSHVHRPEEILFIADFAARHHLSLVWKNGVFELAPTLRGATES